MRRKTVTYIIYSQMIFVITIIICAIIKPHVLLSNNAFSYFGSHMPTAIPFIIGLLSVAATLIVASRALPKTNHTNHWLSRLFTIVAFHLVGIALIPYIINHVFYVIHVSIAYSMGIVFLVASGWLITKSQKSLINFSLYVLEFVGILLGTLSTSEIGTLHFIALGQLIVIFSFSGLLIRTVSYIERVNLSTVLKG